MKPLAITIERGKGYAHLYRNQQEIFDGPSVFILNPQNISVIYLADDKIEILLIGGYRLSISIKNPSEEIMRLLEAFAASLGVSVNASTEEEQS